MATQPSALQTYVAALVGDVDPRLKAILQDQLARLLGDHYAEWKRFADSHGVRYTLYRRR